MPTPLKNIREERFCLSYSQHGNGTRAAQEAGYSPGGNVASAGSRAAEMLRRPHVKQRITELRQVIERQSAKRVSVDRAWVLEKLIENAESAIQADDRTSANRALELVGKELGMFIDRKLEMKSPLDALSARELAGLVAFLDRGGAIELTPTLERTDLVRAIDIVEESPRSAEVHADDVPRAVRIT